MTEIERIIKEVEYTTNNIASDPFTPKGFTKYKGKIAVYISALFIESQKTAKRHKTDNVSESHVETASSYLIKNRESKISKLMGVLGGVLLGAAVSNILALTVLNQSFTTLGLVTTVVLGIIGSFMIGVNMMKE